MSLNQPQTEIDSTTLQLVHDELRQQKAKLERNIQQLGNEKSELVETLQSHTDTIQMLQERIMSAQTDLVDLEESLYQQIKKEQQRLLEEEEQERRKREEENYQRKKQEEEKKTQLQSSSGHSGVVSSQTPSKNSKNNKSIDPLWADRFSSENSLQREYESLLIQKDSIQKELDKLMEENDGLKQKLISQHEVLKMLRTRVLTATQDLKELQNEMENVQVQQHSARHNEICHDNNSLLSIEYIMNHEGDFTNPQQVIKILKDHIRKLTSHK
ncbi:hypothetical protein FDP41_007570 [Naegleria fowleri]|uniref:Uncharacterized protein n=1 Tax=Naegleria fowleri TaxID=5763 RepID=A0A6A5CE80_NAEFO|nr:uncharacterized protein FDP41_007570 [Naegleria fowleri]KAF0983655.1 hypothetical protein FDP41_007570 [Naegleria fowleri]